LVLRTFRGFMQLFGGLTAGMAIVLVLLAWRLSSGPISLAFLSPYIEDALGAQDGSFRVSVEDTILTWAGWERTLDIRLLGARAIGRDGNPIATVPELSMSLSASALIHGKLAPRSVELFRPSLALVRRADGRIAIAFQGEGGATGAIVEDAVAELLAPPNPDTTFGRLLRVRVTDADLTLRDQGLGVSWKAPSSRIFISRDAAGIKGEVSLDLAVADRHAHIGVFAEYQREAGRIDLGFDLSDVNPVMLSGLSPELAQLAALDVPMQGTATLSLTVDGAIEGVSFDLTGGKGRLTLPDPVAQSLDIAALAARGRFEGGNGLLEIEDLSVDLGKGGKLRLPAPVNHVWPLQALRASGRYRMNEGRIEVASLKTEMDGARAEVAAIVGGIGGAMTIDAKGTLFEVPADQMGRYWPRRWGTDAYDWCVANLSDGLLRRADAKVSLRSDGDGGFGVVSLAGTMELDDFTVDYLAPMPKGTKVDGTVEFDRKQFDITVLRGEVAGLTTGGGRLLFTGLDAYDQYMDIDLRIDGPVRKAIELIDHEPLGFASVLGMDPASMSGTANTRLKLQFILENALTRDQVDVLAVSKLHGASVKNARFGYDVSGAEFDLQVDKAGMDVSGTATLGTVPVRLEWRENFADKASFQSRFHVVGRVGDAQRTGRLGLDFPPFSGEFMQGDMGADVTVTTFHDGHSQLRTRIDMTDMALAIPAAQWNKVPGVAAKAQVDIILVDGRATEVPRFVVAAGDLRLGGSVRMADDGNGVKRIDLDRLAFGRTDMRGVLFPRADGGWDADFKGAAFDLGSRLDDLLHGAPDVAENGKAPPFSISFNLDRVWLGADREMTNVAGAITSDGDKWRKMQLQARLGDGQPFEVFLKPTGDGLRHLSIQADDAGTMLRTLGYYDNMVGGTLKLSGRIHDTRPGAPIEGKLVIEDYRVIKAPTLAHLVSILSLTGIIEALEGEGLSFNEMQAPFLLGGGVLNVKNARATGMSLGYTASGKIYTSPAEVLDIQGTVVPAYAINSVLGNIPVIGDLFTGGEKGGGVFAATYTMTGPLENPKLSVNPLSALAPGFFRKLFGIFDSDDSTSELPGLNELKN
jgi:hypothetical protein